MARSLNAAASAQVSRPTLEPSQPLHVPGVQRGAESLPVWTTWQWAACRGRFVEVSGSRDGAALSLVFRLIYEAQREGEPVVWVGRDRSIFYPPDVAETGVDLESLVVVRTQKTIQIARVADRLIRSGAFGIVLMDLGAEARLSLHAQTRLNGLAKKHETALIGLTEKEALHPSIGSLVSLRAQTSRERTDDGRYRCEARVLKDKRGGPGWSYCEVCRGPDGLR